MTHVSLNITIYDMQISKHAKVVSVKFMTTCLNNFYLIYLCIGHILQIHKHYLYIIFSQVQVIKQIIMCTKRFLNIRKYIKWQHMKIHNVLSAYWNIYCGVWLIIGCAIFPSLDILFIKEWYHAVQLQLVHLFYW